jgi:2-polyprenyl-6-methoxyphenol hydroxylase-like FAD-dependent oxidoreductase
MKCTIHSDHGSIMIIPRENNMVRLYIQIASSTDKDFNPRKQATSEEVQASAKKILQPYHIEWDRVEWYSIYPIGQGIAEKYTIDHRIFMGGDCCHTHSVCLFEFHTRVIADIQAAESRTRHEHSIPRRAQSSLEDPSR